MPNVYRGEVSLVLAGEALTIRFNWDALAKLRDELGERYDQMIITAASTGDVRTLAKVVAIGSDPPRSEKEVIEGSPPVDITAGAVLKALSLAVWGEAGPPAEKDEQNPHSRNAQTWWQKLGGSLSGSVGRRVNSGSPPHMN